MFILHYLLFWHVLIFIFKMEAKSGNVSVDWTLFESELMDTLGDEDLPEDDE